MAEDELSELRANLAEYKEQLVQLEELLLDEPDNEDYRGLFADVEEAISLTEQALKQQEGAATQAQHTAGPSTDADAQQPEVGHKRKSRFDSGPEGITVNGALPQQVVDQIKSAKARSALDGRAPPGWAIGHNCLARGSSGQWEPGKVAAVSPAGGFLIAFDAQPGIPVEVHRADAKPRDFKNYEGVKGPIRKAVTEVSREAYEQFLRGDTKAIPAWMQIKDTDGPKAREKKTRAIKAFKKRLRFERKDLESTRQANDWKAFVSGKGKKKKAGFMTGTKKESMFSVPDNPNSKVGVVGSGRGMTNPSSRRNKLDF
eukprot:jgi/Ulvmu1/6807/UM031_0010.1